MESLHVSTNIRGKQTQIEILDNAWDLISQRGADVSIAEIARSAGVSRQNVYLHFGTRGGLLIALVRRADQRFGIKAHFDKALENADPEERLKETLDAWLEFVPKIYPVASELIRLRVTDKEAAAAWEDRMADLRAWLLDLTYSLQKDNTLSDSWTAKTAADYIWAQSSVQVWGLLTNECDWVEEDAAAKMAETIADSILRDAPEQQNPGSC